MSKIIIHTDGSSKGNPGPGGWSAVIEDGENILEIGGREPETTNNKMEITAAIQALQNVEEGSEVEIFSDSEYLIKGITLWIWNWQKNNWRTKAKKPVLNQELWQALFVETEKRNVEWKKVSGHSLNDRCDEIAQTFADGNKLNLYDGPKNSYKF